MRPNKNIAQPIANAYDKTTLLQPEKIIINYSERHSMLVNSRENSYYYGRILSASNAIIKEMFALKYPYYSKEISDKEWDKLTDGRCIELKYDKNMKIDAFIGTLGVRKNLLNGIENVSDIIIASDSNKIYFADMKNKRYYEYANNTVVFGKLDSLITEVSDKPMISGIFLNKLYPERAASDFIMPAQTFTDTKELPAYSAEKELDPSKKNDFVSEFFNSSSTLSIIRDSEGAVTYNDREGATVRIDANGVLEYVRYNLSTEDAPKVSLEDALSISSDFVSNHLGFPEDSYLTGVQSNSLGTRYLITYNYRQEGIPVLFENQRDSSAIEIELVGREVKRYKRQIVKVGDSKPLEDIKSPISILDAVFNECSLSSEKITQMNNMRVVYLERMSQNGLSLIPAWIVDVVTEKEENGIQLQENRQYVINAETGLIIGK